MKKVKKYKKNLLLILLLGVFFNNYTVSAHHYKGLPHYNYFDNYPQVPIFEYIEEGDNYTVFATIYNFQGLSLEMVDSPNDVRFYIYLYDLNTDKAYEGEAAFNIYSHGKLVKRFINMKQEEERIYTIKAEIIEQDDLILESIFTDKEGQIVKINMPIEITNSFFDSYGLYLIILLFFVVVGVIKKISDRKNDVLVA